MSRTVHDAPTTRKRKKLVLKMALAAMVGVVGLGLLYLSGYVMANVTRTSETADIFNDAAELSPELVEAVRWNTDAPDLARPMEPLTRDDVTAAWLRAWTQISIVAGTGDTTGLDVYFSNTANDAMVDAAADWIGSEAQQISHELTLTFYSEDGQVIGLRADEVRLLRTQVFDDGLGYYDTREAYEVVLLLEDGNWRVQHWVRQSAEGDWWAEPIDDPTSSLESGVAGINYYPRDTPFDLFLPGFDRDTIGADLDRISALGLDSVRIFLDYGVLGGRWVDQERLARVSEFLDLADERDLRVVVTLFDGRTDHNTERWDADDAHAASIVTALAGHPALLMWDLKNEADRDVGIQGASIELIHAWLAHVGRTVRSIDPDTPITVGWSTPSAAIAAPPVVDVISFHYYGSVGDFEASVDAVQAVAGDRPVIVTEFGLPTWNTFLPGGHSEEEQASYYADLLTESRRLGLDGTMSWTLWDLRYPPRDAGSLPWRAGPQVSLGVLRPDGSAKPAAAVLDPTADLALVPRTGPVDRLTKPFWLLTLVAIAGIAALVVLRRRRRHRSGSPSDGSGQLEDRDRSLVSVNLDQRPIRNGSSGPGGGDDTRNP